MNINLKIDGVPLSQPRARAYRVGSSIRMYDPARNAKKKHQIELIQAIRESCEDYAATIKKFRECEHIHVEIQFEFKSKKNNCFTLNSSKPDIDNLIKYLFDMSNGILWSDDRKICSVSAKKINSDVNQTLVKIRYES